MRKSLLFLFTGALVTSCYSESRFGTFDQAQVITIAFQSEASPSVIDPDQQSIAVTLPADADIEQVELTSLQISSLATSNYVVGDSIDLSDNAVLVVTAENGDKIDWQLNATVNDDGEGPGEPGFPGMGGAGGSGGDCETYVLNYQVVGTFVLTDTPGGLGDGTFTVGPGSLSLRIVPREDGHGDATLLSYDMPQYFQVDAPGATSINDSHASAGPDACGVANGELDGNQLAWAPCDYGPSPPLGSTSWSAEDIVGGPGCINGYYVDGTVTCSGSFCQASGVEFPIDLDDRYPQPLNSFVFGDSMSSFTMRSVGAPPSGEGRPGVELPNKEPSRSWIGFDGTLTSYSCEAVPSCD